MTISKISFKAETTKVNNNNQINKNTEKSEVTVDKEKSMSMEKMVGLGIAAALAIGGIYYVAKHGKAKNPKSSTTPTPSTSPSGAGNSNPIDEIKTIIKKRPDGTLNKEIVLDKDGKLISSKQYDKDGTTLLVEKIKTDADTLIKKVYGKNSTVEHFSIIKNENGKDKYQITKKVTRSNVHAGNHKIEYFDELGRPTLTEQFDKKTGKKLIESWMYEYSGKNTDYSSLRGIKYGQGKSKLDITEYADGTKVGSRYDSKGNLRERKEVDGNGKLITHEKIDKKGRKTILENKDGRINKTKIFTNKNGDKVKHSLYLDEDISPQYGTILIAHNDEPLGKVSFDLQKRKKDCNIQKENFTSYLHYNEDGTKRVKLFHDEYGFHTREYNKSGQKAKESIRTDKTITDQIFDKGGNITSSVTKQNTGELLEGTKYYNPKKDGDISSFSVSHDPKDGTSEIYVDYKGDRKNANGLRYNFSAIKFDKQGNIILDDYSNPKKMGDINEIRAALMEIGEEGILKDLYRPHGQTSLF